MFQLSVGLKMSKTKQNKKRESSEQSKLGKWAGGKTEANLRTQSCKMGWTVGKVLSRRVRLTRLQIKISLGKLGKARGVNSGSKEPSSVGTELMGEACPVPTAWMGQPEHLSSKSRKKSLPLALMTVWFVGSLLQKGMSVTTAETMLDLSPKGIIDTQAGVHLILHLRTVDHPVSLKVPEILQNRRKIQQHPLCTQKILQVGNSQCTARGTLHPCLPHRADL